MKCADIRLSRRSFLASSTIVGVLAATGHRVQTQEVGTETARQIAIDAYIYGYSLVTTDITRLHMSNVDKAGVMSAPLSSFFSVRGYREHLTRSERNTGACSPLFPPQARRLAMMRTFRALLFGLAAAFAILSAPALLAQEAVDLVFPDGDRRISEIFDNLRTQTAREARDRQTATGAHAQYLDFKKAFQSHGVTFQLSPTFLPQWGSEGGGPAVQWMLAPYLNWDIFKSDTLGQGSLQVGYFWGTYSTAVTGASLAEGLGMLSPPNSTPTDIKIFDTLTYTQVFPGNKVQVTLGQFGFDSFDTNGYAGNEQTNFINNSLSWNASSTYSLASLGGYVQVNLTPEVSLAFGAQNASNVSGETIELDGVADGPWAWFAYGKWTPSFSGFGSAKYSLLYYEQPSVPDQPAATTGWSLNAVQNLNDTWGLFARVNGSTGPVAEIDRSAAFGVVGNDPFERNPDDQLGLGVAWNKTNAAAFGGEATRGSEVAIEGYWNLTVGKLFQIGPDIQVVLDPALDPGAGPDAVFSLRLTGLF